MDTWHYKVSFAPSDYLEYCFYVDADDECDAGSKAREELQESIGYDASKDFDCVKTEPWNDETEDFGIQDSNEKEPIQDSNVKYYIADIEERIGDHQPTRNIIFKTEGDPQAYLADIVKGFYGDEPNEDEPNSGVYWNETMEKVCYAGVFTEVSKEIFETVSSHLSDMTGYGFSEQGVA
jgi:hypothetical protein